MLAGEEDCNSDLNSCSSILPDKTFCVIGEARVDSTVIGEARVDSTVIGEARVDSTVIGKARVDSTVIGKARVDSTVIGEARVDSTVHCSDSLRHRHLRVVCSNSLLELVILCTAKT